MAWFDHSEELKKSLSMQPSQFFMDMNPEEFQTYINETREKIKKEKTQKTTRRLLYWALAIIVLGILPPIIEFFHQLLLNHALPHL